MATLTGFNMALNDYEGEHALGDFQLEFCKDRALYVPFNRNLITHDCTHRQTETKKDPKP